MPNKLHRSQLLMGANTRASWSARRGSSCSSCACWCWGGWAAASKGQVTSVAPVNVGKQCVDYYVYSCGRGAQMRRQRVMQHGWVGTFEGVRQKDEGGMCQRYLSQWVRRPTAYAWLVGVQQPQPNNA